MFSNISPPRGGLWGASENGTPVLHFKTRWLGLLAWNCSEKFQIPSDREMAQTGHEDDWVFEVDMCLATQKHRKN